MRLYNRYVLTLAISFSVITLVLALRQVDDVPAYFSADVIIYLAITALFIHLNPNARKNLSIVSAMVIAVFITMVIAKALATQIF